MLSKRVEALVEKFSRGLVKSQSIFGSLSADEWDIPIWDEPDSWSMKDLIAHFIFSEEHLLAIAQDISAGGEGAPEGIEIDSFNETQMERMRSQSFDELLPSLDNVRASTVAWTQNLDDESLDRMGRHPTLGIVNVETVLFSIYAHQLLHMREVGRQFDSK
jgi:hypothetical protein